MGVGKRGVGARPPSQVAYYVALGGILALLVMLLVYFACFCIKRVKELVQEEYRTSTPAPPSYPVQPVVRDSAKAMAKLCRTLPAPTAVYPAASSPAAQHTEHDEPALPPASAVPPAITVQPPDSPPAPRGKIPAPPAAALAEAPAVR